MSFNMSSLHRNILASSFTQGFLSLHQVRLYFSNASDAISYLVIILVLQVLLFPLIPGLQRTSKRTLHKEEQMDLNR